MPAPRAFFRLNVAELVVPIVDLSPPATAALYYAVRWPLERRERLLQAKKGGAETAGASDVATAAAGAAKRRAKPKDLE